MGIFVLEAGGKEWGQCARKCDKIQSLLLYVYDCFFLCEFNGEFASMAIGTI